MAIEQDRKVWGRSQVEVWGCAQDTPCLVMPTRTQAPGARGVTGAVVAAATASPPQASPAGNALSGVCGRGAEKTRLNSNHSADERRSRDSVLRLLS